MAKRKSSSGNGTSLVIVESPAKARTISKFLGRGFQIEASIGHIRDLPEGAKEIPEQYKGEDWAYLGVKVHEGFEPVYVIPKEKLKQVRKLKDALKQADALYLATDEDREGEAISWHLCEVLQPKVPVHRLVFHEITEEAIREALGRPRQIDNDLVRAQEVRRIVDRLYGYDVSPLLWRKIRPRLSAGRVQSVAVRLIVQREQERMRFIRATYWDILGTFAKTSGESFQAEMVSFEGRRVPEGRDFDPATGRIKDPGLLLLDEAEARRLVERLRAAPCRVAARDDRPYTTRPYPPFTTSTLQQEANRKYGFTARYTMQLAQSLYENGHITYMRTDSTSLASAAIDAARELVAAWYGPEYLPPQPRIYQTKVKNAQEAHEAIRPAGHPFDLPDALRGQLGPDHFKLYELIWKRTIASQMADARGHRITIAIELDGGRFEVSGKTIEFPGFLRAYVEGSDDPEAELADQERVLPSVTVGEALQCLRLESKGHATKPPGRYSEASLTRTLEEMGIGRPSTYASIIDTILARDYVFKLKRGNVLVPTWTAFAVSNLLVAHLEPLVDYQFTARMEDELDAISRGELDHVEYLRRFYFGNDRPGLKQQLASKADEIDARQVSRIPVGQPEGQPPIVVRVGRFGPFLEQGDRRASIPNHMPPDELTVEKALELLDQTAAAEEPLGICPETGKPIFVRAGRFGPYVQRGTADEGKPQNASLLKGMTPEEIDLETALRLLSLPRTLGRHPDSGEEVLAYNGRYGPYVKCGSETRSLPDDLSPLDVTLEQALELLAQPKRGRRAAVRKEPLQVFDPSPATGEPIRLMEGRWGPYVTDGQTNASLPRGTLVDDVTFEQAVELLLARAESAPSRTPRRRASTKKASAPSAKKRAAKGRKKTPKKKKE
jgi:DNA topoisomerase I